MVKSVRDLLMSADKAKQKPTTIITTSISANVRGTPFSCSQNRGGVLISAINKANKNGTRIGAAAFIPAATTTKQALTTKNLAPGDAFSVTFIGNLDRVMDLQSEQVPSRHPDLSGHRILGIHCATRQ